MNRIEFMNELEHLLIELPKEERIEAMQFYIDYFNDAGVENEQTVIAELGSPMKVAKTIKADIGDQDANSEYSENGYTDARFEEKEILAERGKETASESKASSKPWTSQPLKIVLIILVVIAACTVAWPVAAGIFGAAIGLLFAAFGLFIGLVIGAIAVMFGGAAIMIIGLMKLSVSIPVGLVTSGCGLLLIVLGLIATVATIKLCMIVYPAMIRGIVYLVRIPFHGRKGKAVSK